MFLKKSQSILKDHSENKKKDFRYTNMIAEIKNSKKELVDEVEDISQKVK